MDGILLIDKPAGPTSHDVVSIVKRLTGAKKVGHLGTLDPEASGVLPLAINGATKMAGILAGIEKVYEFTLCLGRTTDTDDNAGTVTSKAPVPRDAGERLKGVLDQFTGSIMQRPPKYSAVKVNGRRAYDLARKGTQFEIEPRSVRIDSIEVVKETLPEVRMRVACNSGTYVRSLCRDIGEAVGCGGCARDIRRLRSGPYIIDKAVGLEDLKADPGSWEGRLIPM
jgi:tRNA pseudouridine55 synthase